MTEQAINKLQHHMKEKLNSIYKDEEEEEDYTPSLWEKNTPELLNSVRHLLCCPPLHPGDIYYVEVKYLIDMGFPIPLVMNPNSYIPISALKVKKIHMGIILYLDYNLDRDNSFAKAN